MTAIVFPTGQLIGAVDAVAEAIEKERRDTCEVLGVQLLQFIQLAYEEKSHGKTGEDGIAWEPITVDTVLGRLRKAGHLSTTPVKHVKKPAVPVAPNQRVIYKVARTEKHNKKLFGELEAAGVEFYDKKGKKISGAKGHKAGTTLKINKATRENTVRVSPGAYQVGVDTGLQRASASPGFVGPDGKGGNVFRTDEVSFTVGFGRNYSVYFDRHRKLIPDTLPDAWLKQLEELAADRQAKVIDATLKEKGVS